jgi:EAL domain-containing protein (putative c-di-GMP-specific phosphodiesterase class I)
VESQIYRGLDLDLERAIRANELELAYQPQVQLASGRAVGVEALLRWRHLKAGDVAPATIIGIAERTGLIGALTFWIFNAALRQLAQWRAADIAPRIALNLSASTLGDRELPAIVDQSLKTWGIAPDQVVLEVPEEAMLAIVEAERQQAILTRLEAVGVQLAIDDFGSGYTSLAQLRRLPFDEIKIDRPFVGALLQERADAALVRSAIDIAHNFDLRVVAEGVERPEVLEELRRLGCDLVQGNLVSPPLPPAAFREWWSKHA